MDHTLPMIDDATGSQPTAEVEPFRELLERRDRVNAWLARLDAESDASPRVAERVRNDYLDQLTSIMSDLAGHYEALRERRGRLEVTLAEARAEQAAARDELDEAELRHRIGELDAEAWDVRRAQLQPAADAASSQLDRLTGEADELEEVIREIRSGIDAPDGGAVGGIGAVGDADDASLPRHVVDSGAAGDTGLRGDGAHDIGGGDIAGGGDGDGGTGAGNIDDRRDIGIRDTGDADLTAGVGEPAFPADVGDTGPTGQADGAASVVGESVEADREDAVPPLAAPDGDDGGSPGTGELEPTRPGRGVKCMECGYTNDYGAIYCGVCGIDLA